MYSLVYAFFMCELQKISFLRDMMYNQCANIFSTRATVYGSHSAMFTFYFKREYFFFMCILNLVFFKTWFVSFFSPPPKLSLTLFFPQLVLFFPIFIGGEIFFNLCCSQGELSLFMGGVVSIFYRVELFFLPLILYFLLSFIAYVYSLLSCFCQYVTKSGRSR